MIFLFLFFLAWSVHAKKAGSAKHSGEKVNSIKGTFHGSKRGRGHGADALGKSGCVSFLFTVCLQIVFTEFIFIFYYITIGR